MYRTVAQLDALTGTLANWFPQYFSRVQLPEPSIEGRAVYALRLRAGNGEDRRGVLLVGGTHARELMNPDALVELAVDLFVSHAKGTDVVYGNKSWSADEVRVILDTLDIWLVPCSNPDGRHHVMTVDDMWRKNRRDLPGTTCDGVDLNRNLDLLWGVTEGSTSCSPCTDVYCGPSAFSEPETRNVKHLLDSRRIDCFVDVHSYSELVLYPWGHAPTQTTDTSQRFTSLPTGTCSVIGRPGYGEFMPPPDLQRFQTVGQRVVDAIAAVRGRAYTSQTGVALYPTTGTHSDYAYARHISDESLRKTYGFTFETGPWVGNVPDSFHPADPRPVKRDAKSGLIALMQQCICAIELIGTRFLEDDRPVERLRTVRDDLLATTEAGREWIALYERSEPAVIDLVLDDEGVAEQAADLVRRAAEMVDADAELTADDVERADALLDVLAERTDEDTRRDVERVRRRLGDLEGRTVRNALESLMQRSPDD